MQVSSEQKILNKEASIFWLNWQNVLLTIMNQIFKFILSNKSWQTDLLCLVPRTQHNRTKTRETIKIMMPKKLMILLVNCELLLCSSLFHRFISKFVYCVHHSLLWHMYDKLTSLVHDSFPSKNSPSCFRLFPHKFIKSVYKLSL